LLYLSPRWGSPRIKSGTHSNLRPSRKLDPAPHGDGIERPIQLAPVSQIAEHRHAGAVAILQLFTVVHPHAVKIRHASLSQHGQRLVAQMAVIALIEHEM